jgi:hypothetical protein
MVASLNCNGSRSNNMGCLWCSIGSTSIGLSFGFMSPSDLSLPRQIPPLRAKPQTVNTLKVGYLSADDNRTGQPVDPLYSPKTQRKPRCIL